MCLEAKSCICPALRVLRPCGRRRKKHYQPNGEGLRSHEIVPFSDYRADHTGLWRLRFRSFRLRAPLRTTPGAGAGVRFCKPRSCSVETRCVCAPATRARPRIPAAAEGCVDTGLLWRMARRSRPLRFPLHRRELRRAKRLQRSFSPITGQTDATQPLIA